MEWGGVAPTLRTKTKGVNIMECKPLGFIENGTGKHQSNSVYSAEGITPAITTIEGGGTQQIKILDKVNVVGQMESNYESSNRVYGTDGVAPCINTCGGGNLEPKILAIDEQNMILRTETVGTIMTDGSSPKKNNRIAIRQATEQGYIECEVGGVADLSFPDSKLRRGRVQGGGNVAPTIMAGCSDICRLESKYRIRKLTPRECWRLMSFTDEEFDKAASVQSNTQLYKQAGNSIVVDVLVALFSEIVNAEGTVNDHVGEQITFFDLLGE